MDECERCGSRLPWHSGTTTLIGAAQAVLCVGCRNAWHTHYLTLPEHDHYQAFLAHKAWLDGRALAGDAPSRQEWELCVITQQQLMERLFALGQAWLAAPVAAP